MFRRWLCLAVVFCASFSSLESFASCQAGPVIFRDTLYGAAIGGGFGALLVLANAPDSRAVVPSIATSAVLGGGIGALVGVAELNLSCGSHHYRGDDADASRLSAHPVVTENLGLGLGLTYDFGN